MRGRFLVPLIVIFPAMAQAGEAWKVPDMQSCIGTPASEEQRAAREEACTTYFDFREAANALNKLVATIDQAIKSGHEAVDRLDESLEQKLQGK